MARSAQDATRFTATGPYAHSKATHLSFASPPPPNETPQQKIARLREAARRAKLSQESKYDKIVAKGRVWADRAHRFTAMTLIVGTGVATIIAAFSLGDMVLYNRKKRKTWLQEQEEKKQAALAVAREAFANGTADADQMLLINRERAAEEARKSQAEKKGVFASAKAALFGGFSKEEETGGKLAKTLKATLPEPLQSGASKDNGEGSGILKALDDSRREAEKVKETMQPHGGPLDNLAEDAAATVNEKSKSWTSWMTGR